MNFETIKRIAGITHDTVSSTPITNIGNGLAIIINVAVGIAVGAAVGAVVGAYAGAKEAMPKEETIVP